MLPFPASLETPRLLIKPSDPADAEALNRAVRESYAELRLWMPWADHLPALAETRSHLAAARQRFLDGTDCGLTLWLKSTGAFAGASGLHPRPPNARFSLGLVGLEIRASERNTASHRVAERAGFQRYRVIEDGRVDPDGTASRTVVYVCHRGRGGSCRI